MRQLAAILLAVWLALSDSVAASQAEAPADSLHVEVSGHHVTVQANGISIRSLLEAVAKHSDLQLVMLAPLEETVTLEFEQRAMPDAIRSILRHRNFALQYGSPRANVLWVFSGHATNEDEVGAVTDGAGSPVPQVAIITAGRDLADVDATVRLQAVLTLADARDGQAVLALAPALVDTNAAIREEAAAALGGIGGHDALVLLGYALMDLDRDVRETAIEAFAEIGSDEAAQALAPALNDADAGVRTDAVDALGEIGGPVATELLRQALADEEPDIRAVAAGYLATLSAPGR